MDFNSGYLLPYGVMETLLTLDQSFFVQIEVGQLITDVGWCLTEPHKLSTIGSIPISVTFGVEQSGSSLGS